MDNDEQARRLPPSSRDPQLSNATNAPPYSVSAAASGSAIQVSVRQRGNPVLTFIKNQPWEYSDSILADYVVGATTCALFLSLKYHRLHPEYIYARIRNLQGKYNLRILLTMVDIPNHEDAIRELSKTSVVSGVTVMLCWSAAEAARYLELYKSYEQHTGFTAIRGQQTSSYVERLVDFVTVPRSINKADAVALVSNFGSLRNAINADADQVGMLGGWGGVKVKRWCDAVQEPFRARGAAARRVDPASVHLAGEGGIGEGAVATEPVVATSEPEPDPEPEPEPKPKPELTPPPAGPTAAQDSGPAAAAPSSDQGLAPGIAAALAKLREQA